MFLSVISSWEVPLLLFVSVMFESKKGWFNQEKEKQSEKEEKFCFLW
jgi:hypothetical protein